MNKPDNPNPFESPQEVAAGSHRLPRRLSTLEMILKVIALIFFLAAIPVCTFITFFATCLNLGKKIGYGAEPNAWVWICTAIVGLGMTALWIGTLIYWIRSARRRSS